MTSDRRTVPVPLLLGSFVIVFMMMAITLPEWLRFVRPNLIAVLLVYWLMRIPESIGIGFAWIVGFVFDGVSGGALGLHALSFSLIAYLVLALYQRIRMFVMTQQALLIFILLAIDQLLASWIAVVIRGNSFNLYCLIGAAMGALCWPLVSTILSRYQRHFSMA